MVMADGFHVTGEILSKYYQEYFPLDPFIQWLGYGDSSTLNRREFSFTLEGDIYTRFRTFGSKEELHGAFVKDRPQKIDIGAVYNQSCKHRLTSNFKEEQRELVFDIDISDYDEVRTCCQEAAICQKCWPLMAICVKVLKQTLEDDFGYTQLLFVFSGRRGIHCWVFDKAARHLGKNERFAIAHYCQVTAQQIGNSHRIHPTIERAVSIADEYWEDYLRDQDLLVTQEGVDTFLSYIKIDDAKKSEWKGQMLRENTTQERWSVLEQHNLAAQKEKLKDRNFITRIKIACTYPRIDIKVTEGFNHLLKAPFSIHPKTGKVCVPFKPEYVDDFVIEDVPTVFSLRANDEKVKAGLSEKSENKKYEHGEMKEPVKIFTDLLKRVFKSQKKENEMKK